MLKPSIATALFLGAVAPSFLVADSTSNPIEHVIEIKGFKFVPAVLTIKSGDTITWINKDIVPHTATADDSTFDTGELKQNESISITVVGDGEVSYFCEFHPSMRAALTL